MSSPVCELSNEERARQRHGGVHARHGRARAVALHPWKSGMDWRPHLMNSCRSLSCPRLAVIAVAADPAVARGDEIAIAASLVAGASVRMKFAVALVMIEPVNNVCCPWRLEPVHAAAPGLAWPSYPASQASASGSCSAWLSFFGRYFSYWQAGLDSVSSR